MNDIHPKKLFLLDAYALIFRAYYALLKNPRITSKRAEHLCNFWISSYS